MDPDLTIVLLGNSGVGKSASGNTILGRTEFDSLPNFRSVTNQISEATADVFGKRIKVVDTPGILGAEREIQTWCQDLLQSSSPCLFLVVFKVGPFAKEQNRVVATAIGVIGSQGFEKCHLLFTGGDALKGTLEDFFADAESSPPDTFSKRCHLFDNKNGGQEQVRELLVKSGHLSTQHLELPDRRIVLLGLPGAGKSSSGNTILGSDQFRSAGDFDLVTPKTVSESATVEGRKVTVVDTPGLTDEVLTPKQLFKEIMKSVKEASPGPHAFVVVVRIGSMSNADIKLFELLSKLFDTDVCDAHQYSMVLFTHGDELEGRSIDDLIKSNTHVSALVSMFGGRYCVFDNKAKRSREQVRHFLNKIDEMVTANGGEHWQKCIKQIRKVMKKKKKSLRAPQVFNIMQ